VSADLNLSDLEHLFAVRGGRGITHEHAGTILRAALERLRRAHREAAAVAMYPVGDVRPALRKFLREYATVHGRTIAEQVAAFTAEGNPVFLQLAVLGWGIAFDVGDD
jgi:hypothetical protein